MTLLDDIQKEISELSDEQIAEAASKIVARKQREKARMTPDKKEQMKQRETRRRQLNAAILKAAKEKGLVPAEPAAAEAPTA